jgi:hypothetical protein
VDSRGTETFVNPSFERVARGSIILDAGSTDLIYGLTTVQAGNDHLYWAQADFVRRVSMVTAGFFDTLRPNLHALEARHISVAWPGLSVTDGLPNLQGTASRRVQDLAVQLDPPADLQPAGTSVLVEVRGAETIANSDVPWDRLANNRATERTQPPPTRPGRKNLLNPEYASDAFRLTTPNLTVRVLAEGLTPYADLEHIDTLRDPVTRLLPRYLNFRVVFENDINVSSPKRPSLRSMAIVYRVTAPN